MSQPQGQTGKARAALVLLALLLGSACGRTEPRPAEVPVSTGAARVVVLVPRSLPSGAVARVVVMASSAEGGPTRLDALSGEGELWQARVDSLRAGPGWLLQVEGQEASGRRLFEAREEGLEVAPQGEALVVLTAPDVAAAPLLPGEDSAPRVDALVLTGARVEPGGTLGLRARVGDVDSGDVLTLAWRATAGRFDSPAAARAHWTAPEVEGPHTLTLEVTDSRGAVATLDVTVRVGPAEAESLPVAAAYNRGPRVEPLRPGPSVVVAPGEAVAVEVAGRDGDGDALSYAWSASCEGTWTGASQRRATFVPSVGPVSGCAPCQLTVAVGDGRAPSVTKQVEVCVRPPRVPPVLLGTSLSAQEAEAGDVLRLGVRAADPHEEPLTVAWSVSEGLLSEATGSGGASQVAWTALSCVPGEAPPRVTVRVTNESGLSVSHDFEVSWRGRRCNRPACAARVHGADKRVVLEADCETEGALVVPPGFTLDGAGRVLRAVEAPGVPYTGPVVRNRGDVMHVRDLVVEAQGLEDVCHAGPEALRGVLFEGAEGTVVDSEVRGLHQGGGQGGCQEGHGIEARNVEPGAPVRRVDVLRTRVTGYQKTGILVVGRVDARLEGNEVDGGGPTATIARNGIQFDMGATGQVTGSEVRGNAYTGPGAVASGVLVLGGSYNGRPLCTDIAIEGNVLTGNDVGLFLFQAEGPNADPPAQSTRLRLEGNTLRQDAVTNGYVYQAGISDLGGANRITGNEVLGAGYSPGTLPGSTFAVDVVAGPAARVAFLNGPQEGAVGQCLGPLVVQTQDEAGNLKVAGEGLFTLEALGEAAPGATFHAEAGCAGEALTGLSLAGPQAEARLWFKATRPGALTVRVTGEGLAGEQLQTVR